MNISTIEIAARIEAELIAFLKEKEMGNTASFTRFIDLGGSQTDLRLHLKQHARIPWMVARIKSVNSEQDGVCVQFAIQVTSTGKSMKDVMVGASAAQADSLAKATRAFLQDDLLAAVSGSSSSLSEAEGEDEPKAIEGDAADDAATPETAQAPTAPDAPAEEDSKKMDFDPEEIIKAASEEADEDKTPLN